MPPLTMNMKTTKMLLRFLMLSFTRRYYACSEYFKNIWGDKPSNQEHAHTNLACGDKQYYSS